MKGHDLAMSDTRFIAHGATTTSATVLGLAGWLLLLSPLVVSGHALGYLPMPYTPPPAESLALLDLYSAGTMSVADLRPVLRSALAAPHGEKAHIKFILYAGVQASVVRREDVSEALTLEGCGEDRHSQAGVCREVRELLGYGRGLPGHRRSSSEERDALLDSVRKWGSSNLALDANYMIALVTDCQMSLEQVVEVLISGNLPNDSDPSVLEAAEVLASPSRFRDAAASAFAARIRDGSAAGLTELRALRPELLTTLWETMDRFWPPLLEGRTKCLVDRLRLRAKPPDRWQSQRDRLVCDGLF